MAESRGLKIVLHHINRVLCQPGLDAYEQKSTLSLRCPELAEGSKGAYNSDPTTALRRAQDRAQDDLGFRIHRFHRDRAPDKPC